jgi:hypothetical protein
VEEVMRSKHPDHVKLKSEMEENIARQTYTPPTFDEFEIELQRAFAEGFKQGRLQEMRSLGGLIRGRESEVEMEPAENVATGHVFSWKAVK